MSGLSSVVNPKSSGIYVEPDFSSPNLTPIEVIAPTDANKLLACPLRFAFAKDERFSCEDRITPSRALGIAAHSVREAAYRCRAIPTEERGNFLESTWEEAIHRYHLELIEEWAPAIPPPPEQWKRYQLTKRSTLREATNVANNIPEGSQTANVAAPSSVPGTGLEIWLKATEFRLHGKVDRIDRINGKLRVVDVKSGRLDGELPDEYRRQLLLYAVLVHAQDDEWPAEIAIEPITGQSLVLALDPNEALVAAAEVNQAIEQYNKAAHHDTDQVAARPSSETCRFCIYRIHCYPYWEALTTEWQHHSVLGAVSKQERHDSTVTVTLTNLKGSNQSEVQIHGVSANLVEPHDWLACCDIEPVQAQSAWRAKWSSRIAAYPSRS